MTAAVWGTNFGHVTDALDGTEVLQGIVLSCLVGCSGQGSAKI